MAKYVIIYIYCWPVVILWLVTGVLSFSMTQHVVSGTIVNVLKFLRELFIVHEFYSKEIAAAEVVQCMKSWTSLAGVEEGTLYLPFMHKHGKHL